MKAMRMLAIVALLVGLMSEPAQEQTRRPRTMENQHRPPDAPAVEVANVLFRYSPQLAILIVRLRGTLLASKGHAVASFNDPASFVIGIEAAEMRITADQLSALMNTRLTSSPRAQVKDVRIAVSGDHLKIDGTMKKGLHVPFEALADVGLGGNNRIRIRVRQVSVAKVPLKGALAALGLSMADLVSQKGLKGMSVEGDSFLVDPRTAFPPPQIVASLTDARVQGDGIALKFGQGAPKLGMGEQGNYIALRGGRIQYGREEMIDSDLTMTDSTPGDPFEFNLPQYWSQMVAGSIKVTPSKALRVLAPDYSKIAKSQ
jgi:hypothetical protein